MTNSFEKQQRASTDQAIEDDIYNLTKDKFYWNAYFLII